MAEKIVAEFKQKKFERLRCYALNQMSTIEMGLNVASTSRGINCNKEIWIPTTNEIRKLFETLIQLRTNMLTVEERKLLK